MMIKTSSNVKMFHICWYFYTEKRYDILGHSVACYQASTSRQPPQQVSDPFEEYANDSTDEESEGIKKEIPDEADDESEMGTPGVEKVFLKSISYKGKESTQGKSQAKRARLETDVSHDFAEEMHEFGKFVAEQLLCLDVDTARLVQDEIKAVLTKHEINKRGESQKPTTSQVKQNLTPTPPVKTAVQSGNVGKLGILSSPQLTIGPMTQFGSEVVPESSVRQSITNLVPTSHAKTVPSGTCVNIGKPGSLSVPQLIITPNTLSGCRIVSGSSVRQSGMMQASPKSLIVSNVNPGTQSPVRYVLMPSAPRLNLIRNSQGSVTKSDTSETSVIQPESIKSEITIKEEIEDSSETCQPGPSQVETGYSTISTSVASQSSSHVDVFMNRNTDTPETDVILKFEVESEGES